MLRTVQSLPLAVLSTRGFDPARFQTEPPVCYRASWQLPGPDSHRQATTSTNTKITRHITRSPPVLLGARKIRVKPRSTDRTGALLVLGRDSGEAVSACGNRRSARL